MAGRGRPPKETRRNAADVPTRGEIQNAEAEGWQHGETPAPPDGLMPASAEAWRIWMSAWFASFWTPADLPGLRRIVQLYDQVERGEFQRSAELRLMMDTYGITPKGQQDRRWQPPKKERTAVAPTPDGGSPYGHLKAV